MLPASDLLFAHSNALLMSDFGNSYFGNLTEFDDFSKDMFLSNPMEGIVENTLLEELDCKDEMKPLLISDVNDDLEVSLTGDIDDMNSSKVQCSAFTMLFNEEPSEPLQFMAMPSKVDSPGDSDALDVKRMGPTSIINYTTSGSSDQGVLSPRALVANEMNCMSLDDLDLTQLSTNSALCGLTSPLNGAASLGTQLSRAESAPSLSPLSSIGKAPTTKCLFRRETRSLSSIDTITPSVLLVNSPVTSPSSAAGYDDSSIFNIMYRHEEVSSIQEPLPQPVRVLGAFTEASCPLNKLSPRVDAFADYHGTIGVSHVLQEQSLHNPSIQRSQSSHALGQLRMSGHIGPGADELSVPLACKQQVPPSSASSVSLFNPYQASTTQGLTGRSLVTPMRKVFSTGDLQTFSGMQNFYGGNHVKSIMEEGVKIGHYTMEERKIKLHRYRQKRTERNFSKKIKYACRKTLADSRPRVRGRFARTDEMGESTLRGSELPLIDEYEEVTSHHPRMTTEETYPVANNSCLMANNPIIQFWSTMGMKVAM